MKDNNTNPNLRIPIKKNIQSKKLTHPQARINSIYNPALIPAVTIIKSVSNDHIINCKYREC